MHPAPVSMTRPVMSHRISQPELRGLTGVRGVAALAVVAYHFWSAFAELSPTVGRFSPVWRRGYMGVDLFFILSGFILCYVYRAGQGSLSWADYRQFLGFRFARVYPNHLAVLLILLLALAAARVAKVHLTGTYPISELPLELTMTHAWPFGQGWEGKEWNYPSWSISAEWFAYMFVFPACWLLTARLRSRTAALLWVFVPVLAYALTMNERVPLRQYGPLIRVTLEFCSGAALYVLYDRQHRLIGLAQRYLDLLCLALAALLLFSPLFNALSDVAILLTFPCILAGLTAETSLAAKVLAHGALRWLGEISYAIYMVHAIPQKVLKVALPTARFVHAPFVIRIGVIGVYLVCILVCAAALYYAVELPARQVLRRVLSPKRIIPPMVAVAAPEPARS
jgi:peptidoglycan/LPS O-acetylase OafA/YrhL